MTKGAGVHLRENIITWGAHNPPVSEMLHRTMLTRQSSAAASLLAVSLLALLSIVGSPLASSGVGSANEDTVAVDLRVQHAITDAARDHLVAEIARIDASMSKLPVVARTFYITNFSRVCDVFDQALQLVGLSKLVALAFKSFSDIWRFISSAGLWKILLFGQARFEGVGAYMFFTAHRFGEWLYDSQIDTLPLRDVMRLAHGDSFKLGTGDSFLHGVMWAHMMRRWQAVDFARAPVDELAAFARELCCTTCPAELAECNDECASRTEGARIRREPPQRLRGCDARGAHPWRWRSSSLATGDWYHGCAHGFGHGAVRLAIVQASSSAATRRSFAQYQPCATPVMLLPFEIGVLRLAETYCDAMTLQVHGSLRKHCFTGLYMDYAQMLGSGTTAEPQRAYCEGAACTAACIIKCVPNFDRECYYGNASWRPSDSQMKELDRMYNGAGEIYRAPSSYPDGKRPPAFSEAAEAHLKATLGRGFLEWSPPCFVD
jgi:hypothetical protein